MAINEPTKPVETYAWLCADQQCDKMDCYKSTWNSQTVTGLWQANKLTEFHDAKLAKATEQIQSILTRLERRNKNKKRKLSFIQYDNRLMLVWAGYGVVGPYDDDKTIRKALKLRKR